MADNRNFSEEKDFSVDDFIESGRIRLCPREQSSQDLDCEAIAARLVEEPTRTSYPPFVENRLSFVEQPRNFPASDVFANRLSLSGQIVEIGIPSELICGRMEGDVNQEIRHIMEQVNSFGRNLSRSSEVSHLGCELSNIGRDDGIEQLSTGRYGDDFLRGLPNRLVEDARIGEEFQSIGADQYLLEESVTDAPKHLRAIYGNNPQPESLSFESYFSLNDISIEYWKLYAERSFENYDFAMNLMAYIELLNDNSWKATISQFDENVKRMIKHIWNVKQIIFKDTVDLQKFNREMTLKLMADFTEWSINRNFELIQFINYCVLMCQLGVSARKRIFKDAPLYAIGQLRNRIKLLKFENFEQFMLEIVVKEYAMRLVEHARI